MTLEDFHRIDAKNTRDRVARQQHIMAYTAGLPPYAEEELREPPVPRQYPTTGQPRQSRTSFKDLTGKRFGRWSVLAEAPKTRPGQSKWHCRCDCGKEKPAVCYTSLTTGRSNSCGCLKREAQTKPLHERHGHQNPTYRSWHAMKTRSGVCMQWQNNFDQFLKDMGPRPAGARLVSLDGRRWSPETCEWRAAK